MDEMLRGIDTAQLAKQLRGHRINDVFVQVTDLGPDESSWFRVHGVRYDPESDTVVVLAHADYR